MRSVDEELKHRASSRDARGCDSDGLGHATYLAETSGSGVLAKARGAPTLALATLGPTFCHCSCDNRYP
jgi:hypothetical protein